jgi:hypothetical protein
VEVLEDKEGEKSIAISINLKEKYRLKLLASPW